MKIKGLLVDVKRETVEAVEVEHSLDTFYKILDCEAIDITNRIIGDRNFLIVCDDLSLFKDDKKISAVSASEAPALYGNLFVVQFDGESDVMSLTEEEIAYLKEHVSLITTYNHTKPYPVLTSLSF